MEYLKVWTSFRQSIAPLADDEKGRLFDAMLLYAETGQEPESFSGNERFLWAVAKQDIDRMAQKCETLRANASKGGAAKSKNKQTLANDSKSCQMLANDSKSNQTEPNPCHNIIKRNENKININKSLLNEDEAAAIVTEQNEVLDAAQAAGFTRSETMWAKLIDLYAIHGKEKMLAAIDECVTHGVMNIAYLTAVLKGEPKKQKKLTVVPAQDYEQRDYSGTTEDAIARMMGGLTK